MLRFLLPIVGLLAVGAAPAASQLPSRVSGSAEVSLITVTPGDALYSLFGHSAIRVHDRVSGLDVVFNYGTFDFTTPWFVPKFVHGALDYQLSASSMAALLYGAGAERRGVVEHLLRLDSLEVERLWNALTVNYAPENRTYRYDFFFDNCSTRIRDIVDRSVSPDWAEGEPNGPTLRHLLRPYTAHRPWTGVGIDLLLGSVTDRAATSQERMFLPDGLDAAFLSASGSHGGSLVLRTDTLLAFPERNAVRQGGPWPALVAGLLLLAAIGVPSIRPRTRGRVTGADRAALAVLGCVGIVLWFLTFFSLHAAMAKNLNVLWALPLHLPVAFLGRRLLVRIGAWWFPVTAFLAAAWLAAVFAGIQSAPVPIALLVAAIFARSAVLAVGTRATAGTA